MSVLIPVYTQILKPVHIYAGIIAFDTQDYALLTGSSRKEEERTLTKALRKRSSALPALVYYNRFASVDELQRLLDVPFASVEPMDYIGFSKEADAYSRVREEVRARLRAEAKLRGADTVVYCSGMRPVKPESFACR